MNILLAVILAVSVNVKGVPFTPMTYERLPELNIPREAHRLEMCNGEFTVFGGHTTGFVSTATAEYFRHGKWHTVNTLYPHDAGFAVKLRNGEVMLGGDYLMVGGFGEDSYDAQGTVMLFHTQPQKNRFAWWWLLLAVGIMGCIGLYAMLRHRKKADEESAPEKTYPDLQERIVSLMEQEQLFRKPDLRLTDIATRLHTNTTYISACINSQMGLSFPRFVTQYRIRYAQQQMKLFPDKKLSSIIDEAGFASENSFFRSFKAETGGTPAEWKQQQTSL